MPDLHSIACRTEPGDAPLRIVVSGAVVELWLDRPRAHHALNETLLRGLEKALSAPPSGCRIFVLRSSGPSFCAGADLAWMAQPVSPPKQEASQVLARVLALIAAVPQIVVGLVQGRAIGGGVGLAAACDYVLASTTATVRLTEGRLGLAPALIAPYLARRTERRALRLLALTGRPLGANEALAVGLFDELYPPDKQAQALERLIDDLLHTAPGAVPAIKRLLAWGDGVALDDAQRMLTTLRQQTDAQAGIAAFFGKTTPPWAPTP